MSIAEREHLVTLSVQQPFVGAGDLFHDAVRREIADRHEACLRWFCAHPATPEDLLLEIYESGLCLDDLGHRQGPPLLLEKLANEAEYPEAILTLGIQLYTDPTVSVEAFSQFAYRHTDHFWMLDTLVRRDPTSAEKESLLEGIVARHPDAERLSHTLQVKRWSRDAEHTKDGAEMERLYATREPAVWLALAGNRAAPRHLVERLAATKHVASARRIRNRARELLSEE